MMSLTISAKSSDRISAARMARASAFAPLLVVVPLLLSLLWFSVFSALAPRLKGTSFLLVSILGVLAIYLVLVAGYFTVALAFRAFGFLSRRSLLMAGIAVSLAIALQVLVWSSGDPLSPLSPSEQAEAFLFPACVYLFAFTCMSWLWWRVARGNMPVAESTELEARAPQL